MDSNCELQLMFAARAEHLARVIWPALEAGRWVLCDRFTDATYAYQGGGRGIDMAKIARLEEWIQGDFRPDLTLLLDVPVEIGLARASNGMHRIVSSRSRSSSLPGSDSVTWIWHDRHKQRYRVIDASVPLDQVQQQLAEVLRTYL